MFDAAASGFVPGWSYTLINDTPGSTTPRDQRHPGINDTPASDRDCTWSTLDASVKKRSKRPVMFDSICSGGIPE
jgi:hypothetical protein